MNGEVAYTCIMSLCLSHAPRTYTRGKKGDHYWYQVDKGGITGLVISGKIIDGGYCKV